MKNFSFIWWYQSLSSDFWLVVVAHHFRLSTSYMNDDGGQIRWIIINPKKNISDTETNYQACLFFVVSFKKKTFNSIGKQKQNRCKWYRSLNDNDGIVHFNNEKMILIKQNKANFYPMFVIHIFFYLILWSWSTGIAYDNNKRIYFLLFFNGKKFVSFSFVFKKMIITENDGRNKKRWYRK